MAFESYEYPDILYCDACKRDVPVVIEEQTDTMPGSDVLIRWQEAVCPVCRKVLCNRDQDRAVMNATLQQREAKQ